MILLRVTNLNNAKMVLSNRTIYELKVTTLVEAFNTLFILTIQPKLCIASLDQMDWTVTQKF